MSRLQKQHLLNTPLHGMLFAGVENGPRAWLSLRLVQPCNNGLRAARDQIMNDRPLLVLTAHDDNNIPLLPELRKLATIVVGDTAQSFATAAEDAEIILNWTGPLALLREVFRLSRRVLWIHSRSAGLEGTLFPELIATNVIVTNSKGIFSPSLGEFAEIGRAHV